MRGERQLTEYAVGIVVIIQLFNELKKLFFAGILTEGIFIRIEAAYLTCLLFVVDIYS